MNMCKRFIEGLKKHNLTHDDIKSWQYIGGTGGRGERHQNYFHLKFKHDNIEFVPPERKTIAFAELLLWNNVGSLIKHV